MLNEIANFNKRSLKKTQTIIRHQDGSSEICKIHENISTKVLTPDSYGFVLQGKPDLTCDEIIPHLFLSADYVACSLEILKKKKITHILNLTLDIGNYFEKEDIEYKRFLIDDSPTQNIVDYFDSAYEFIDSALMAPNNTNNVLVHCNAGVSRSASFVIAYLLKKRIFDCFKMTYDHVKQCRSKICPNKGFVEQLRIYEKKINKI